MANKKIWIRLGGFLTIEEKMLPKLLSGDKDILVENLNDGNFRPDGETYIPTDAPGNPNAYDVSFEIEPESLSDKNYIYIVSSYWAPDIGTAEGNLIVATHSEKEAHDILVREVRSYIDSWHEGDEVEHRTKESYFNEGFTKEGTAYCLSEQPCKVERWVLEESDTYMEFAITRMRIGNNENF